MFGQSSVVILLSKYKTCGFIANLEIINVSDGKPNCVISICSRGQTDLIFKAKSNQINIISIPAPIAKALIVFIHLFIQDISIAPLQVQRRSRLQQKLLSRR